MRPAIDDARIVPARPDLAAAHLRGSIEAPRYAEGRDHAVQSGSTALRGEPDCSSPQLTELMYGEILTVYEDRGGWLWGQSALDGYVGYAERAAFRPARAVASHMVRALFAHLYLEPKAKSITTALLPMTARLALGSDSDCGRYAQLTGGNDWIFKSHVRSLAAPERDPTAVAERFFGAPYLWGGKTAGGIDCSGLIQISLAACGLAIPRDSDQQLAACKAGLAREVARKNARRGDIAFFPGHVGIMVDIDTLLHANATHMAVTVDPLQTVIERIAREQARPFSGLFRLHGLSRDASGPV